MDVKTVIAGDRFLDKLIRVLLYILLISSVFQSFSIFSLQVGEASKGFAPYWILAAITVIVLFVGLIWRKSKPLVDQGSVRQALICLGVFTIYGVVSAFALPFVFKGVSVLTPSLGIDPQYHNPAVLAFKFSNAAQAVYLGLNFALVLGLVFYADCQNKIGHVLVRGYVVAGIVVLVYGLFQHFSFFYFPNPLYEGCYRILQNNPGYFVVGFETQRMFSTFSEPSFFSGFMAAYSVFLLTRYFFSGKRSCLVLGILSFYALLASISTTGYLTFLAGFALLLLVFFLQRNIGIKEKWTRIGWVLTWMAVVGLIYYMIEPLLGNLSLRAELAKQTLNKAQTDSFKYRLWADYFSVASVFPKTFFFGAGLGSNRSSSFLASLISNQGWVGLLSFGGFLFFILKNFIKEFRDFFASSLLELPAVYMGFFTYLVAMAGALPDLSWPPFLWLFTAMWFAFKRRKD